MVDASKQAGGRNVTYYCPDLNTNQCCTSKIKMKRRVLHNTRPVKSVSVVKSAIGLLAASHSDIQGVRITKSFSQGDAGLKEIGGGFMRIC